MVIRIRVNPLCGAALHLGERKTKNLVSFMAAQNGRILKFIFWEFAMEDFDDVPFLTADEIVCCIGFGLLAVGMIAGLLFMAVPVLRWGFESLRSKWTAGHFAKPQAMPVDARQCIATTLGQPQMR